MCVPQLFEGDKFPSSGLLYLIGNVSFLTWLLWHSARFSSKIHCLVKADKGDGNIDVLTQVEMWLMYREGSAPLPL